MNKSVVNKTAMFIWLCLIWILSTLPAETLPKVDALNIDKAAHVFMYFILSLLVILNFRKGLFGSMNLQEIFIALTFLACLDEAHQVFCINRVVSLYDLSANLTGICIIYSINKIFGKGK
jgi:VanZ family protein